MARAFVDEGVTAVAATPHVRDDFPTSAEVMLQGVATLQRVLEEKPQPTTLADPVVPPVRRKLFGAWEMNWLAYNEAQDIKLPGSSGPAVGFLMYPQAETGKDRLDSLDPDNFKYTITARELKA